METHSKGKGEPARKKNNSVPQRPKRATVRKEGRSRWSWTWETKPAAIVYWTMAARWCGKLVWGRPRRPLLQTFCDVTLTDAIIHSLEAQLHGRARPIDWKNVEAIQKKIAALPILDSCTDDEILGYDEFGIPR
jgi:hypothetical protein